MKIALYNSKREYLAGWNLTNTTPPALVIWNSGGFSDRRYFLVNPASVKSDVGETYPIEYTECDTYAEIGKLP